MERYSYSGYQIDVFLCSKRPSLAYLASLANFAQNFNLKKMGRIRVFIENSC